jgi:hypothetical protein
MVRRGQNGMGWREQDAYELGRKERRRALPSRKRYNWRGITIVALIIALAGAYLYLGIVRP